MVVIAGGRSTSDMIPSHSVLRFLNSLAYPVLVAGALHIVYAAMVVPVDDLWVIAGRWVITMALSTLVAAAAFTALSRRVRCGELECVEDARATCFLGVARDRMMLGDAETIADSAMLRVGRRPGIVVLTERRLLFVTFRGWPARPWTITECDRSAVKSATARDIDNEFLHWLRGIVYEGELEIEVVGVGEPQRVRFIEPRALRRVAAALAAPHKVRPVRHGIRLIQYLPRRRALKRRYVDRLFPVGERPLLEALLLSAVFPGLGQMSQGRVRTGAPYTGLFTVLLAAMVVRGIGASGPAVGEALAAPAISLIVVWMASVLELFIHRYIHSWSDM